ncbi:MAG: DUF448 domain-containing protein [Deltaproteobacteria bacterium]
MPRKEAQRSCIACRKVKCKKELLRFVLAPDRVLVPDLLCKLPGRGAYVCSDNDCLRAALTKKQFSRAFKGDVRIESADSLIAQVIYIMEERIASYLSLANKAGKVVSGTDMVMQSLRKNFNNRVLLLAADISADIRQKIVLFLKINSVEHFTLFDKDRLGSLIGKSPRSVVALEGHGFVEAIKLEIERYRNFMGEVHNR